MDICSQSDDRNGDASIVFKMITNILFLFKCHPVSHVFVSHNKEEFNKQ